jgi:hypothetical protein
MKVYDNGDHTCLVWLPAGVDGCKVTQWFVPTSDAQDPEYARNLINAAQDGSPNYNAGLYLRGVVNQPIPGLTGPATDAKSGSHLSAALDPSTVGNPVSLYSSGNQPPQRLTHEATEYQGNIS